MISFDNISAHNSTAQSIAIEGGTFELLIPVNVTSTAEYGGQTDLTVYPNPVSDHVINLVTRDENAVFHLFDHSGRLIMTEILEQKTNSIDVSDVRPGLYVIRVAGKNGNISTGKLIVR